MLVLWKSCSILTQQGAVDRTASTDQSGGKRCLRMENGKAMLIPWLFTFEFEYP